ncbi:C-Jun-amino-terminal kinase-interacting protein 1 [Dermatophagoides farinae]|uniref:C-Jun-amino-terminal kinase-interacting protein 1 n=1 Tax=Dermatophagoides farinae TaxID=6954 RepID=A0A922HUJ0_DERFA|nr:C-Jun-amino-terminal kinase-interacting protein 1 [Dermatophagoides farinae]
MLNSESKNFCQQKKQRRQLPKIPLDKKPFGKIWQMNLDDDDDHHENLAKNLRWKLTMANMLLEIKTDSYTGKTLSIKMLNDDGGDYVHDDDDKEEKNGDDCNKDEKNIFFSPQSSITEIMTTEQKPSQTTNLNSTIFDHSSSLDWSHDDTMSLEMTMLSSTSNDYGSSLTTTDQSSNQRQHFSRLTNTSSDSGVSSNIDSPSTIPSFNEKIEFFESKSSMTSTGNIMDDCGKNFADNEQKLQSEICKKPMNELPDATHRALFKFCARHSDEIDLQIGDAIYLYEEFDDQWSDGLNLRTGDRGIFPSSLIIDVNYSEFMFETTDGNQINNQDFPYPFIDFRIQRDRYNLDFLGSIEVFKAKGEDVLDDAIQRVSIGVRQQQQQQQHQSTWKSSIALNIPFHCLLEISDIGILQITYCGYQFKNNVYYFAFITRHPTIQQRFACHVFKGVDCCPSNTTRDVAEAVGRAFHRFYNRFVQITLPMDMKFN